MISHKHKFIFIHINKTGGSSLEHALKKYCENFSNRKFKHQCLFDKLENNPPLISQCKHLLEEYFKFTIVRNPWDKELSDYFFNKRLGRNVGSNLTEYFNHPITNKPFWHENQLTWITDENNNINADFIGRFESLQEDFNTICDAIGIPRQELPHKNKTKHKHYTEYYDDETRQIVAEKYAKDIEYFGYKFGE